MTFDIMIAFNMVVMLPWKGKT